MLHIAMFCNFFLSWNWPLRIWPPKSNSNINIWWQICLSFFNPLYKFKIMVYRNFIYPLIIFRETDLLACDHPNQMAFGLGSNYTNRPYWIGRKTKGTTYEPPNRSVMCCLSIRSERPRFVESADISANIIKRLLEL